MTTRKYLPPRSNPLHPPEMLRELRGLPMVKISLWNESEVWLATRYEDVRTILRDPRFSSDSNNPKFPAIAPGHVNARRQLTSMGHVDDPRHAEVRRAIADDFLARRIDDLRPVFERIVLTQLDHLSEVGPPADFYAEFALQVPMKVIAELLGFPSLDHERIVHFAESLGSHALTGEQYSTVVDEFNALCSQMLASEETASRGGVLARIQREMRAGRLTHDEATMETVALISAGHITTASAISLGTLMLLLEPEQFRAIREEPAVVNTFVEEVLRYHPPIHYGIARIATADVRVGDTLISAGDGVIVSAASANRDESAFGDPDKFDIRRSEARRHVTFGDGMHKCLGQWVARAELQTVFRLLATHLSTMRLATELENISFTEDNHMFRVRELPVIW